VPALFWPHLCLTWLKKVCTGQCTPACLALFPDEQGGFAEDGRFDSFWWSGLLGWLVCRWFTLPAFWFILRGMGTWHYGVHHSPLLRQNG